MKKSDRNILMFRFNKTLNFISRHVTREQKILDLGSPNALGQFLTENGFRIEYACGFDFDLSPEKVNDYSYDVLTAFEVLEHLVNPFSILQKSKASRLVVSVPLHLWFAKSHRNIHDPYDQHFHEFETWQLDMLLEKAGWKIKDHEKWTPPFSFHGIRSVLRAVTPRFYSVYAERG